MYRIIFTLISALLFVTSASATETKISGTINDATVNKVEVLVDKIYLENSAKSVQADISVTGTFELTFEIETATIVNFIVGDALIELFIRPGDNINIEYSSSDNYKLDSESSAENTLLSQLNTEFANYYDKAKYELRMMTSNIDVFEMALFDEKNKQSALIKNSELQLSQEFKKYLNNKVNYQYAHLILAYPIVRGNKKTKIPKVEKIPDVILNPVLNLDISDDLISVKPFRNYVYYKSIYQTSVSNDYNKFTNWNESVSKKVDHVANNYDGVTRNYIMSKLIMDNCSNCSPGTINKIANQIGRYENTEVYLALIKTHCAEALAAVQKTVKEPKKSNKKKPASSPDKPGFTVTGVDGKPFGMDDLKGKILYVDFWATWCGPCRQQFPHARKLKESLDKKESKEIEFVYISIDGSEATWKKSIEKYGLKGTHGLSLGGWKSKAVKHFGISSIPRYMIFNKDGKLVDPNAKRPSDPRLINDLRSLM